MRPEDKKYILDNISKKSIQDIARDLQVKERKIRKILEKEKKRQKRAQSALSSRSVVLSIVLIGVLTFLVYANVLTGEFIWDDVFLVKNNLYIRDFSNAPFIFIDDIGQGAGKEYSFYRPLQTFTYMIDYKFWKLNVAGFHLTNILIHILTAVSLYFLIFLIFRDSLLSMLAGILFAVHPIHTEAVSYISSRADSLAALFMILSSILYISDLRLKRFSLYVLSLLSFALALLSKEMALILPLVLLLYHYSLKEKVEFSKLVPAGVITFLYIALRFSLLKDSLLKVSFPTTALERFPGFFAALFRYIKLLVLPFGLHMEYGYKIFPWDNPEVLLGLATFFILALFAFSQRIKNRLIFFSIVWFFALLIPHANLYPINAYMAEHWLYLPSIGFSLIIAGLFAKVIRTYALKVFGVIAFVALVGFYSSLTVEQNLYWLNPITFYERTLECAPESTSVYNNLGFLYQERGDYEKALFSYQRAIEIDPENIEAYNNLGNLHTLKGNYKEAEFSYRKAIEIRPDYVKAYNNLGSLYNDIEKSSQAVTVFKKAIAFNPEFAPAYNNLGRAYYNLGEYPKAVDSFKKAIEINPDYAKAYNNLAIVYFKRKEYALAIRYCDKARELGFIDPALSQALKAYRQSADDRR